MKPTLLLSTFLIAFGTCPAISQDSVSILPLVPVEKEVPSDNEMPTDDEETADQDEAEDDAPAFELDPVIFQTGVPAPPKQSRKEKMAVLAADIEDGCAVAFEALPFRCSYPGVQVDGRRRTDGRLQKKQKTGTAPIPPDRPSRSFEQPAKWVMVGSARRSPPAPAALEYYLDRQPGKVSGPALDKTPRPTSVGPVRPAR
jgi:hypothetical protein